MAGILFYFGVLFWQWKVQEYPTEQQINDSSKSKQIEIIFLLIYFDTIY